MEDSSLGNVLIAVLHAAANNRHLDWGGILDACGIDRDRSRSILVEGSGRIEESEALLLSTHLRGTVAAKMRSSRALQLDVDKYSAAPTPEEGLRLMSAFLKISDVSSRISLIDGAEHMAAECVI